jgi:protein involved in ribonucleotide reduction
LPKSHHISTQSLFKESHVGNKRNIDKIYFRRRGGTHMLLAYASKTGNVERFVAKIAGHKLLKIETGLEAIGEPCVLITYTAGFGRVPSEVMEFAERNRENLRGIACSGNRNWGDTFGAAGRELASRFGLPVLHTFEMSGRLADVNEFKKGVESLANR